MISFIPTDWCFKSSTPKIALNPLIPLQKGRYGIFRTGYRLQVVYYCILHLHSPYIARSDVRLLQKSIWLPRRSCSSHRRSRAFDRKRPSPLARHYQYRHLTWIYDNLQLLVQSEPILLEVIEELGLDIEELVVYQGPWWYVQFYQRSRDWIKQLRDDT